MKLQILLVLLVVCITGAVSAKDCSKAKSMAELKACDPQQYAQAMVLFSGASQDLNRTQATLERFNQVMKDHVDTLHKVNQDLRQLNSELPQRKN